MEVVLEALESSLIIVLGRDDNPVGCGVLIDSVHLLTCAHVVNVALGRGEEEKGRPDESSRLKIRFHGSPGSDPIMARIALEEDSWRDAPVGPKGDQDQCLLCIDGPLPSGVTAPRLLKLNRPSGHSVRVAGYPETWAGGDSAKAEIVMVDGRGLLLLRPDSATAVIAGARKPSVLTG